MTLNQFLNNNPDHEAVIITVKKGESITERIGYFGKYDAGTLFVCIYRKKTELGYTDIDFISVGSIVSIDILTKLK